MSLISFAKRAEVYATGKRVKAAYSAGKTLYQRKLKIKDFYGTGVGQIPVHLAPEAAVLDGGGKVTSVPNLGGAGASHNATAHGSITRSGGMMAVSSSYLALANPVNGVGARAYWVIASGQSGNVQIIGANRGTADGQQTGVVWYPGTPRLTLRRYNGSAYDEALTGTQTIKSTPTLIEVEILAGKVRLWVNGASLINTTLAAWTSFPVEFFGQGYSGSVSFTGSFGDLVWMLTDGSAAAASAALAVRQAVAAKHGITVT